MSRPDIVQAAVVFDLDGTLIDSLPDLAAAVNRMLAAEGQPAMGLAEVQSHVGNGAPVLVARVMAARGLDMARHAALSAAMIADYTRRSCDLTRPYPGVPEALAALAGAGFRLGLCTNKPAAPTAAILSDLGLAGFFGTVVAGDTLALRKPDPAPLHAARAALGGGDCLFVGDSTVDALCAQAAGLPFAFFTGGYHQGDDSAIAAAARFDDHATLPALARALLGRP